MMLLIKNESPTTQQISLHSLQVVHAREKNKIVSLLVHYQVLKLSCLQVNEGNVFMLFEWVIPKEWSWWKKGKGSKLMGNGQSLKGTMECVKVKMKETNVSSERGNLSNNLNLNNALCECHLIPRWMHVVFVTESITSSAGLQCPTFQKFPYTSPCI